MDTALQDDFAIAPYESWATGLGRSFQRVAVFSRYGKRARLVAVRGITADRLGKEISLVAANPLRWTIAAASPVVGAGTAPGGNFVSGLLGLATPRAFAVLPILMHDDIVGWAYVDQGRQPLSAKLVSEIFSYCATLAGAQSPPKSQPHAQPTPANNDENKPIDIDSIAQQIAQEPTPQTPAAETQPRPPAMGALASARPVELQTPTEQPSPKPSREKPRRSLHTILPAHQGERPRRPATVGATTHRPPPPAPKSNPPMYVEHLHPPSASDTPPATHGPSLFGWRTAATACLLVGAILCWFQIAPAGDDSKKSVAITAGASVSEIAEELELQGVIRNPLVFRVLAKVLKVENELKAGTYDISNGQWPWEILKELRHGQVVTRRFTVPEGLNLTGIAAIVEEAGFGHARDFIRFAHSREILDAYNIPANSVEGYLFPETYTFAKGISAREVLVAMLDYFFARANAIPGFDTLSPAQRHQKVIIASIVERETKNSAEMPRIAGVFQNRLEQDIKLESCATVQYVLGETKPRLTVNDVRTPSPYNTYLHKGLPPGPIANPGFHALHAAMLPERNAYLFFFARGDGSGSHVFSQTFEEHQKRQKTERKS